VMFIGDRSNNSCLEKLSDKSLKGTFQYVTFTVDEMYRGYQF
jgi:hypothetical protein